MLPNSSSEEIAGILNSQSTAIFCGAGISYNSGLPIVSALLNYLFSKLELTEHQKSLMHQGNLPFESIMEMTLSESGLEEIMDIFREGVPNANHTFIAKLGKNGYVKIIYTTNFDILIEKALEKEGLLPGIDFKVYSSEESLNTITYEDEKIQVVKIHGCVTQKEEMVITMSMIASNRYLEMRKNVMHAIFGGIKCSNVLVMGYSCSDIDLTAIIKSFDGKKANIHFVDHQIQSATIENRTIREPVAQKNGKNPFQQYEGVRHLLNTDELVKEVWCHLFEDEYYNEPMPQTAWRDNIDAWYATSAEQSGEGVKHHIASRLLYAIGEFEEAIKHNKNAISIALHDGNELAYAAETGNMGMAFNALADYNQAKACFDESIPLCRKLGLTQGLSAQLQALGNWFHRTGDNKNAIIAHLEALKYAEIDKDENSISNILGNMSNCYNQIGDFASAKAFLEKALTISRRLGNMQAESSQLGIIAYTYFQLGDTQRAITCCLDGISIKKSIGDRQGECQLLSNLMSLYIYTGDTKNAKNTAKLCLEVARAIKNREVEQMVFSNMTLL